MGGPGLGEADGELHGAPVEGAELKVEHARDGGLVLADEDVVVVQVAVDQLLGQVPLLPRGGRSVGGGAAARGWRRARLHLAELLLKLADLLDQEIYWLAAAVVGA